jgi:thiamine biosynthesis lipoprotein
MIELEGILSDWKDDSELARLCERAGGGPVVPSPDLYAVLELSQQIAARSSGAFDVTVGPLTRLWREHRAAGTRPSAEERSAAHALVGWRKLALSSEERSATLAEPGMRLDLGGVGKGYACDRALDVLREHGLGSALVEIGGDMALGDPPPGREAWSIAVACTGAEEEQAGQALQLVRQAVATSGDAEQHVERDGQAVSHVIDPRTGRGLTNRLCASVVAADAATADALASAVCVLGEREGRALVAQFPGSSLIVRDLRWVELFDGETLDGWVTEGGRYDGRAEWSVEDGCITGRTAPDGAGGLLYTQGIHADCEVELEVRIEHPFDSGLFLRMAPQGKGAQVTLDDRPGGEIAGIYSDGWLQHNPGGVELWRAGEWNHLRVRCTGADMRIQAWLNGELAVDYQVPPGSEGYAPRGRVGVQVHGAEKGSRNAVRFRNLRLLPLD